MELRNQVICGDCLKVLPNMPDDHFDLVVTSPPYNVNLGDNKHKKEGYDLYEDNKEHSEYIDWLSIVFYSIKRKLRAGGRVAINIGDGKNGRVPTHSDVIQMMTHRLHFLPMATIIWMKNQVSPRTAWGSWMSPSNPSFPMPFEYILVFSNGEYRHPGRKEDITVTKDEFIQNSYAMWTFPPERRQRELGHPAVFPVELPRRCLQMFTYAGDRVLDPFAGVGTTGKACAALGREFTLIELSPDYCETSRGRIDGRIPY